MLLDSRVNHRMSDLRNVVHRCIADCERALEPTEPTSLELRQALQQLAHTPAVRQAMGNSHTRGCECPLCVAEGLLR